MPHLTRPRPGVLPNVLPGVFAALGLPGHDPLGLAAALAGVRQVAVLLIDGFGYHLMASAARTAPTIADIHAGRLGHVRSIVCGFPSTTPVSLSGLGTGSLPGGHGILGFSLRVPDTGTVLNHVHWATDPDPEVWQPLPTEFERAASAGIGSSIVLRPEFEGSGLTRAAYRGAGFCGAEERHQVPKRMLRALRDGVAMVYGYHNELDRAGHVSGVDSDDWRRAARDIDRTIAVLVESLPADAALVITADHGQLNIPDAHKIDIDGEFCHLRDGVETVAGEARARYLHTTPGAAADVLDAWRETLGARALVVSRAQAIDEGWYGPVSAAHAARIGDVIAVSLHDHAVTQSVAEPGEAALVGYHGAFTPVETDVPLIVIRAPA